MKGRVIPKTDIRFTRSVTGLVRMEFEIRHSLDVGTAVLYFTSVPEAEEFIKNSKLALMSDQGGFKDENDKARSI